MNEEAPTVFESFNARALEPEQVAKTFVPPSFFQKLTSRCHSTLVGPRGSGKTSLLKMLQPHALESWGSPDAQHYRNTIDFTGVLIQSDISWNKQTTALVEGLPPNAVRAFRTAAFTTQVLHALVETFCWRVEQPSKQSTIPFRRVEMSFESQCDLVKAIKKTWQLLPVTDTLPGLKQSLSARLVEIWQLAQNAAINPDQLGTFPPWMGLDFLTCINFAVEVFDDAAGQRNAKWALLFDELELAPKWIMEGLLAALRSTTPRFLFKLALNPFDEGFQQASDAFSAAPLQDYNEILLWNPRKEDGHEFSRKLFLRVLKDQNFDVNRLEDLVGRSASDAGDSRAAYAKGSERWRVLFSALKADPSFYKYWKASGINIHRLDQLSEKERAAKVRKIYPIVYLRSQFRVDATSKRATRQTKASSKSLKAFHGVSDLLDISEGNPRWIVGITQLLIEEAKANSVPIKEHRQAAIIEGTIHRFRARLKTISIGPSRIKGQMANLLSLVDAIGNSFGDALIKGDFTPQPNLCFTVDSNISEELATGIGRALNAGAIMYVPEKDALALLHSVKGKRFRLSYLLAPYFRLPLRLGESISLSRILSDTKNQPAQDELPLL